MGAVNHAYTLESLSKPRLVADEEAFLPEPEKDSLTLVVVWLDLQIMTQCCLFHEISLGTTT